MESMHTESPEVLHLNVDVIEAVKQKDWKTVWQLLERTRHELKHSMNSWRWESAHACNEGHVCSVVRALLKLNLFKAVGDILKQDISNDERTLSIKVAVFTVTETFPTVQSADFVPCILPQCSDDELEYLLTAAVKHTRWQLLFDAIKHCSSRINSEQKWRILAETFDKAEAEHWITYLLPVCNDDHLPLALEQLVGRGMWQAVGAVLDRGVDEQHRGLAEREARRRATVEEYYQYISYHCPLDQVESILTQLVRRGHWKAVGNTLQRHCVSDEIRRWAVKAACLRASDAAGSWRAKDDDFVTCILPLCPDDMLQTVLKERLLQRQWESVGQLLSMKTKLDGSARRWAVHEARKFAKWTDFAHHILPHCEDVDVDCTFVVIGAVQSSDWKVLGQLLQRGLSAVQQTWIAEGIFNKLCTMYANNSMKHEILQFLRGCNETFLKKLLEMLLADSTGYGTVDVIDQLLKLDVCSSFRKWAVEEASKRVDKDTSLIHLMHHCSHDQTETISLIAIRRNMFKAAKQVLEQASDACKKKALDLAMKMLPENVTSRTDYGQCLEFVLSFISLSDDEQIDSALKICSKHRFYDKVHCLVVCGRLSESRKKWAVTEMQKMCVQGSFPLLFIKYATTTQLESMIVDCIVRHDWQCAGHIIEQGVSLAKLQWALEEACRSDFIEAWNFTLSYCSPFVDMVLDTLKTARKWQQFLEVLQKHKTTVSDIASHYSWLLEEVDENAHLDIYFQFIDQSLERYGYDHVLTQLLLKPLGGNYRYGVQEGHTEIKWKEIQKLLMRGAPEPVRLRAIHEACRRVDNRVYDEYVLPIHQDVDELDTVFLILVQRKMWHSVSKMIPTVSEPLREQAIGQAAEYATDSEFASYFVSHCSDNNFDYVVNLAVSRLLWTSVAKLLQKGNGCCKDFDWVVDQAIKYTDEDYLVKNILPCCDKIQILEKVLKECVSQQWWGGVLCVLERGVSEWLKRWTITQACASVKDEMFALHFLAYCDDEHLKETLDSAIRYEMWVTVSAILQRGVSDSKRLCTIDQAAGTLDDVIFTTCFLTHCKDEELDTMVPSFVERGLWAAFEKALQRGIGEERLRWAIEKSFEPSSSAALIHVLLHHYNDCHLDRVMKVLEMREEWDLLAALSWRDLKDTQRSYIVRKVCEQLDEQSIIQWILPFCQADDIEVMTELLLSRGLYKAVTEVLRRGVSSALQKKVVEEIIKKADYKDMSRFHVDGNFVMPFCTPEQKRAKLTDHWQYKDNVQTRAEILNHDVGEELLMFVVKNAMIQAGGYYKTVNKLVVFCTDTQLDCIFEDLLEHGHWQIVLHWIYYVTNEKTLADFIQVFERNQSLTQPSFIQPRALQCLLIRCSVDQRDSMLKTFVACGLWQCAIDVVDNGVSVKSRRDAITEASLKVPASSLFILKHIDDDVCDSVLENLCHHQQLQLIEQVLQKHFSTARATLVYEKCHQSSTFSRHTELLMCSTEDQLHKMLQERVRADNWFEVGTVLQRGVSMKYHQWAIEEASKRIDDGSFQCYNFCELCVGLEMDDIITQLISRGMWGSLFELLQIVGDDTRERIAKTACAQLSRISCGLDNWTYFITFCSVDNLKSAVKVLVTMELWDVAVLALRKGLDRATCTWVVKSAFEEADDDLLARDILPFSTDMELKSALPVLLKRGAWKSLSFAIERRISNAEVRKTTAEHLVKQSLTGHLFQVLQCMCKDERHQFVVSACSVACEEIVNNHLLPWCSELDTDALLTPLLSRKLWNSISLVMRTTLNDDDKLQRVVVKAVEQAEEDAFIKAIIPRCGPNLLKTVLLHSTQQRKWKIVGVLLRSTTKTGSTFKYAFTRIWTFAEQSVVVDLIWTFRKSQTLLEFALKHVLKRQLWSAVGNILKENTISKTSRLIAVRESIKHADEDSFLKYIFPVHLPRRYSISKTCDISNEVLAHLVERGFWRSVAKMFDNFQDNFFWECDRDNKSFNEGLNYALFQATHKNIVQYNDLLRYPRLIFFKRDNLEPCASETAVQKAVLCASQKADETALVKHLLGISHGLRQCVYADVLNHLVRRGLWQAVGLVLRRNTSEVARTHAVLEACSRADEPTFVKHIFPSCNTKELEHVFKFFIEKRNWEYVGHTLLRVSSETIRCQAVEEASKYASVSDFAKHILPHCLQGELVSVLQRLLKLPQIEDGCNHDITRRPTRKLSHALVAKLVEGENVKLVQEILQHGVLDICCKCLIKEIGKNLHEPSDIVRIVLPHIDADDNGEVVRELLSQGLIESVSRLLLLTTDRAFCGLVLEECSKNSCVNDEAFVRYILPCITDKLSKQVFETLISRHMWMSVSKSLAIPRNSELRQWATVEGSQKASCENFIKYILPHCAVEDLQAMMENAVSCKRWQSVAGIIRNKCISDSVCSWAIQEASKEADARDFLQHIVPLCSRSHLESAVQVMVSRGLWSCVSTIMQRGVSPEIFSWVIDQLFLLDQEDDQETAVDHVLPHCKETVHISQMLKKLLEFKLWKSAIRLLTHTVRKTLYCWALGRSDDQSVVVIAEKCTFDLFAHGLPWTKIIERAVRDNLEDNVWVVADSRWCSREIYCVLTQVMFNILLGAMSGCTDETPSIFNQVFKVVREIFRDYFDNHRLIFEKSQRWISTYGSDKNLTFNQNSMLDCLRGGLMWYQALGKDMNCDILFLKLFAACPFYPDLHNGVLLHLVSLGRKQAQSRGGSTIKERWSILKIACMSGAWENTRRLLFRAAVEEGQWEVVTLWADHTVFDDLRLWALEIAYQAKAWSTMLKLAQHGLIEVERKRVFDRVARFADLDVVLQGLELGMDITEARQTVENMKERKPRRCHMNDDQIDQRHCALSKHEIHIRKQTANFNLTCIRECNLPALLFKLNRTSNERNIIPILKSAVEDKSWGLVTQLIKFIGNTRQLDVLFQQMVREQQWGICRLVLDKGVSDELCRSNLQHLIELEQWALVARIMEYNVGDDARQKTMRTALKKKEGSVVWQCIHYLQRALTAEERESIFRFAFAHDVWQAVMPLIEIEDSMGLRHRDVTLLEVIEQKQWDVVDHCMRCHADIDMKDDKGETPLHRAARKRDWETVEALVKRGADPNIPGCNGEFVLDMALLDHGNVFDRLCPTSTVKVLIEYHADIHRSRIIDTVMYMSPLQKMVTNNEGELIGHTLIWSPDQNKGVNGLGETPIHAVCMSGRPNIIRYLIARKVNPMALTDTKCSALTYAVFSENWPHKMVAECIREGLSTHQPLLTALGDAAILHALLLDKDVRYPTEIDETVENAVRICSSFEESRMVLTQMLYESGALFHRDLHTLHSMLLEWLFRLEDSDPSHKILQEEGLGQEQQMTDLKKVTSFRHCVQVVKDMATVPHSLQSSCRLVISHRLSVGIRRENEVASLPLPMGMKNYVMFSDLTDPEYGNGDMLLGSTGRKRWLKPRKS